MIAPAAYPGYPGQGPFPLPTFPRADVIRWWFAVARIRTGEILYRGQSLYATAEALLSGTCYGAAEDREEAEAVAVQSARWFRDREQAARQEGDPPCPLPRG